MFQWAYCSTSLTEDEFLRKENIEFFRIALIFPGRKHAPFQFSLSFECYTRSALRADKTKSTDRQKRNEKKRKVGSKFHAMKIAILLYLISFEKDNKKKKEKSSYFKSIGMDSNVSKLGIISIVISCYHFILFVIFLT